MKLSITMMAQDKLFDVACTIYCGLLYRFESQNLVEKKTSSTMAKPTADELKKTISKMKEDSINGYIREIETNQFKIPVVIKKLCFIFWNEYDYFQSANDGFYEISRFKATQIGEYRPRDFHSALGIPPDHNYIFCNQWIQSQCYKEIVWRFKIKRPYKQEFFKVILI